MKESSAATQKSSIMVYLSHHVTSPLLPPQTYPFLSHPAPLVMVICQSEHGILPLMSWVNSEKYKLIQMILSSVCWPIIPSVGKKWRNCKQYFPKTKKMGLNLLIQKIQHAK
jgi:hypothetical protein